MTWTAPATPVGGTPITVSFYNTNIRDNLLDLDDRVGAAVFTVGMIMYWNQDASIPSGWAALAAAAGRFIIAKDGTFTFDSTGGATTHTHVMGDHSHGTGSLAVGDANNVDTETVQDPGDESRSYTEQHQHSLSGSVANAGGGSSTQNASVGLPPYIAKTAIVYTG